MALEKYPVQKNKELVTQATDFTIITGQLYKLGANEVMHRYILEHEWHAILVEVHEGVAGGPYVGNEMTKKILRSGLWWPTIHHDSHDYCKSCDTC